MNAGGLLEPFYIKGTATVAFPSLQPYPEDPPAQLGISGSLLLLVRIRLSPEIAANHDLAFVDAIK